MFAMAALVIVASCSSDSDTAETVPSSVLAPPATAAAASTVAIATTSTSVSTSTSLAAATTSEAPVPDAQLAVRAAIDLAEQTYSACLVAMPACDPTSLAVARAGDLLTQNSERIEQWNALGYTVREREAFRYVIESVEVDTGGAQATVTVCIADGSKIVQPGAAPDGSDVIVDDEFVSGRSAWDVRLDSDGVWRAYGTEPIGEAASEDVCGAG